MEKISSYSPTPFILKCFCNKCYKKRDEEKLHVYKLYSVITHVGPTMVSGHYIAYTCSLDIYNEYVSCVHDKRRLSLSNGSKMKSQQHHSLLTTNSSSGGGGGGGGGEKNSGLMKKLIYGRNKASSSGDMSKSLKPINGLSKIMMNGIEKLNLNSDKINATNGGAVNGTSVSSHKAPKTVCCNSANCCGIYIKDFANIVENYHNNQNGNCSNLNNGSAGGEKLPNDNGCNSTDDGHEYESNTTPPTNTTTTTTNTGSAKPSLNDLNQKVWYMCDDDKIKIMTQREFEEALSRNQKVMITPYLLFYARYDVKNLSKNPEYD
jgi:ubiquitin carboxyl-terminal hydrolase 1